MKLDLSEVAAHLGKRIRYEIDEPPLADLDSALKCVAPVVGEITFSNTGRHIVVRGSFRTSLELECARCLRPYRTDLSLPIDEALQIAGHLPDMPAEEEEEELQEEEKEPLFEDDILDLTELLRQSVMVAVPIKPLCSEECKGLCPRCGKNLDEGPCGCPPDEDATPFLALASLIEPEEENQ